MNFIVCNLLKKMVGWEHASKSLLHLEKGGVLPSKNNNKFNAKIYRILCAPYGESFSFLSYLIVLWVLLKKNQGLVCSACFKFMYAFLDIEDIWCISLFELQFYLYASVCDKIWSMYCMSLDLIWILPVFFYSNEWVGDFHCLHYDLSLYVYLHLMIFLMWRI